MHCNFGRATCVVLTLLLGATVAVAQRPQGEAPLLWHRGIGVLGYVQVRDELKLTGDQINQVEAIGDEFIDKHVRAFEASAEKLSEDERRRKFAELKKVESEGVEKAKKVLTAEQAARLRQIEIWRSGPPAFADEDVVRALELTEQQKGVLKTIGDEYLHEVAALGTGLRAEFPGRITREERAKRAKRLAEIETQRQNVRAVKEAECMAALTDEQKLRFEKLRGEKFEIRRDLPREN